MCRLFAPTLNGPRLLYNGRCYSLRLLSLSLWAVIFSIWTLTVLPQNHLRFEGRGGEIGKHLISLGFPSVGRRLTRQDAEKWKAGTTEQKIIRQVSKLCFLLVLCTSCSVLSDFCTTCLLCKFNSMIFTRPQVLYVTSTIYRWDFTS